MNPFTALGLPTDPDLTDEQVRAAWRAIAAATHPDRPDGGDVARYTAAADRLRPAPHRMGPVGGLRRPGHRSAVRPRPGRTLPGRARCRHRPRGPAGPGPHPARAALASAGPRPGRRRAVAAGGLHLLPGQPSGPAVVTGLIIWFVLHRTRGPGPAAGPVKDDASGGGLRLGDGGHQARPPQRAGVEGLPVTSPSSRDKPSRPGQAGQDRSSSGALHLDRPGPARTPGGRDDGEVTASQARKCAHAHKQPPSGTGKERQ